MKDVINGAGRSNDSICVARLGPIGFLLLSQPATLNALTLDMVDALHAGLREMEADDDIRLIAIRSSSDRAFCSKPYLSLIDGIAMGLVWESQYTGVSALSPRMP